MIKKGNKAEMLDTKPEKRCCVFDYPSPEYAWENFSYDEIEKIEKPDFETLSEIDHSIIQCGKCGAIFLKTSWFLPWDYVWQPFGDEQYDYYYLVDSKTDALQLSMDIYKEDSDLHPSMSMKKEPSLRYSYPGLRLTAYYENGAKTPVCHRIDEINHIIF